MSGGMHGVLRLKGVNKRFGGVVVADQITLDIRPGEILGLIGPNGAGKTSLFNLISGVVPVDSGSIHLGEQLLTDLSLHARARAGVARTWQLMRLFGSLSVLENLLIAATDYPGESLWRLLVSGASVARAGRENRARARHILERMDLSSIAHVNVNDITFGQQKLVGLARALMSRGPLLLLDEPMAGVEGSAYETMRAIVREEAQAGRAVCVVEHNVSFIRDLCNSAVFMAQGKILERGSVACLLESKTLAEQYFGQQVNEQINEPATRGAMAGDPTCLKFNRLNVHYGKLHVLHDLAFVVPDGQRVGIFGHNGAGKTTLLRACMGDLETLGGSVCYRGNPVHANAAHRNVAYGMAFVPQGDNVFRDLQVRQNLKIAGMRRPAAARAQAFEEVYALFPLLAQRSTQLAGLLSGGQQQMLALGMALMTQPSILLLDEPTVGLTPVIVRDVLATISQVNRARKTTVLIVEQNVQATLANIDRAIVIKSGRIIYDGAQVDLLAQESLWNLF